MEFLISPLLEFPWLFTTSPFRPNIGAPPWSDVSMDFKVFFKAGFIESWGRGYKKIREELHRVGMPMPLVEEVDGGVLAVMKRFTMDEIIARRKEKTTKNVGNLSEKELSDRQWAICEIIIENPYTTAEAMSVSLKVSARTIERDLSALQKLGVIRREGKRNTGIWVILENITQNTPGSFSTTYKTLITLHRIKAQLFHLF